MDVEKTLELIQKAIELGSTAIKLGHDATPFALALWNNVVNKKIITTADLEILDRQLTTLSNRLQAPLPPADDQDV